MKKRSQVDLHRLWLIIGLVVVVLGVLFLAFSGKTFVGQAYVSDVDSYKTSLEGKGAVAFFPLDTLDQGDVIGTLSGTWTSFGLPEFEIQNGELKVAGNGYVKSTLPQYLIDSPNNPFTISTWVKTDVSDTQTIFQVGSEGGTKYGLYLENGILSFEQGPVPTVGSGTINLADGRWHFITVVYDGSNFTVYLDNVQELTVSAELIVYDTDGTPYDDTLNVGAELVTGDPPLDPGASIFSGPENFFTGSIGEVVVYDQVLTVDDMNAIKAQSVYSNLVAHWRMEPVPGALDISALVDYEGTNDLTGNLPEIADKCVEGACFFFDGATVLTAPENLAMDIDGPFSFSLWVNTRSQQKRFLLHDFDGTNGYELYIEDGTPKFITGSENPIVGSDIADGQWHHLAVTVGSTAQLYVDGVATSASTGVTINSIPLMIGGSSDNKFLGYLDEIKFYKEELTQQQVDELFMGPSDIRIPPLRLVAHFPMETHPITDLITNQEYSTTIGGLIYGFSSSFCAYGNCIKTTGANFKVQNRPDIQGDHKSMTIGFWFKPQVFSGRQMLFDTGGTIKGYNIYLVDDKLWAGVWGEWGEQFLQIATLPELNYVWHHVAITMDSLDSVSENAFKVYYNGNLIGSGSAKNPGDHPGAIGIANVESTQFPISPEFPDGDYPYVYDPGTTLLTPEPPQPSSPAYFFNGYLDDLRIYNDILTEVDFADLYDNDKDGYFDPYPLDCNDDDPAINPGATEICGNSIDENCDQGKPSCQLDEECNADQSCGSQLVCYDLDDDGTSACLTDADHDGVPLSLDCDDDDGNIQEDCSGRLTVMLQDTVGNPVPGLPVTLTDSQGSSTITPQHSGGVIFTTVQPGEFTISVALIDGLPATRAGTMVIGGSMTETFVLNQVDFCSDNLDGDSNGLIDCQEPSCSDSGSCDNLGIGSGCSAKEQCTQQLCINNFCSTNQPPNAPDQTLQVYKGSTEAVTLNANDPENQPLTYTSINAYGNLIGYSTDSPTFTYEAPDLINDFTLIFDISDGYNTVTKNLIIDILHCGDDAVNGNEVCDGVGCNSECSVPLPGYTCDSNGCTSLTGLDNGEVCSLNEQCASGICLSVCLAKPGDLNGDHCVDKQDLDIIVANLDLWCVPEVPLTPIDGDVAGNNGQGDGCVNNDDIRAIIPSIGGCS